MMDTFHRTHSIFYGAWNDLVAERNGLLRNPPRDPQARSDKVREIAEYAATVSMLAEDLESIASGIIAAATVADPLAEKRNNDELNLISDLTAAAHAKAEQANALSAQILKLDMGLSVRRKPADIPNPLLGEYAPSRSRPSAVTQPADTSETPAEGEEGPEDVLDPEEMEEMPVDDDSDVSEEEEESNGYE